MKEYQKIEEQIAQPKKMSPKFAVALSLTMALVGGGLLYVGAAALGNQEVLAENLSSVSATITPVASVAATISPPPTPPDPNQPQLVLDSGWNMVSADKLQGGDFYTILKYGFLVYSFNDPSFPDRDWTVFSLQKLDQIGGESALRAIHPLGYYIYNSAPQTYHIPIQTVSAPSDKTIARGWHILFFDGSASTKDELLEAISLKYSDGTTMSAKEASSDANHRISTKIYVVVNEHAVGADSVKELTGADTVSTISRVPANSFIWFYTRRTKDAVTQISTANNIGTILSEEKTKIDAWLSANNFNQCGDPEGTVYTGGSCLFNEATGQQIDKYEYLVNKFPQKPWNSLATPAPTITAAYPCIKDETYENSAVKPVTCACPAGYAFKVISTHWGACPQSGMTDCPVSVLQCVNK